MNIFSSANNWEEAYSLIDKALENLGITGPETAFKRDGETWRELYILKHGLKVSLQKRSVSWPITIEKRESPDFIIHTNLKHYGVEVTEAISEEDARERSIFVKSEAEAIALGTFGGAQVMGPQVAAKNRTQQIQNAITKKTKLIENYNVSTDLLIYPTGNNVLYCCPEDIATIEAYYKTIENHKYHNQISNSNVWIVWDDRSPFHIKHNAASLS